MILKYKPPRFLSVIREKNKQSLVLFEGNSQRTLDVETIPDDVLIDLGAFGDAGEWRSKWARIIDLQNEMNAILKEMLDT